VDTLIQIGIEDSPYSGTVTFNVSIAGAQVTDAQANDIADKLAETDYAISQLTGTPAKSSVTLSQPEQTYP
jgi:hypothetical protein